MKHLLICPNCGARYEVEDLTGTEGLDFKFECVDCGEQWTYKDAYSKTFTDKIQNDINRIKDEENCIVNAKKHRRKCIQTVLAVIGLLIFVVCGFIAMKQPEQKEKELPLMLILALAIGPAFIVAGAVIEKDDSAFMKMPIVIELEKQRDELRSYLNDRVFLKNELDNALWLRMFKEPKTKITELNDDISKTELEIASCKAMSKKLESMSFLSKDEELAKETIDIHIAKNEKSVNEMKENINQLKKTIAEYNDL